MLTIVGTLLTGVLAYVAVTLAWERRKPGPTFRPPARYRYETLLSPQELSVLTAQTQAPLRRARVNYSELAARLERVVRVLTHADLARALEQTEWDVLLLTGPEKSVAELKVWWIRKELSKRAARAEGYALDPNKLEVGA